jgi:hypothetical protein
MGLGHVPGRGRTPTLFNKVGSALFNIVSTRSANV